MQYHRLLGALAALTVSFSAPTRAEDFPSKPITVIVPFPAGGASDAVARLLSAKVAETLKQPLVVDNRPGANGSVGAAGFAQMKPDGYALMVASIGVFAINPALYDNLRYDPEKQFEPISVAVRTPNVLVTHPSFPAKSVAEFIAHLKTSPNTITFASSGSGSSDHLTTALFWNRTQTSGVHTPYKGGAPAVTDLVAGHVQAGFLNLGNVAAQIKAGRLKLLAIAGDVRIPAFPDAPTMAEAGVEGMAVYSWQAVATLKGVPADVKGKLEAAFVAAAQQPDVRQKFDELGFETVGGSSADFAKYLSAELARWKKVVTEGKITAD